MSKHAVRSLIAILVVSAAIGSFVAIGTPNRNPAQAALAPTSVANTPKSAMDSPTSTVPQTTTTTAAPVTTTTTAKPATPETASVDHLVQSSISAAAFGQTVDNFYADYIHSVNTHGDPQKVLDSYLTPEAAGEVWARGGGDYDATLCAQNTPMTYGVKTVKTQNNKVSAEVTETWQQAGSVRIKIEGHATNGKITAITCI